VLVHFECFQAFREEHKPRKWVSIRRTFMHVGELMRWLLVNSTPQPVGAVPHGLSMSAGDWQA